VLNRPAARFVAIGLFLMAFFTALWASWSLYGLSTFLAVALIVIFGAFAVIFVINGVQLFRSAAGLPLPVGAEAQRRGRILQVGFGVTFASEGVVIAIVCALLAINDGYAYFAPAIALVVGLHFIPFGFLFRRSIDFYIAAWAVIWAIVGIWLIASQTLAAPLVASLVGVATACGTSAYGVYMLRVKRAIMAALDESVHPASQQANARLRVQ
jgi:flagellar biosynthesis protein FliQ